MWRRSRVVGVGVALGALLALGVAGLLMPDGTGLRDRAFAWAAVMGGPVPGTARGWWFPAVGLGWLGLLLVPAHPAYPHAATGLLTTAGLCPWFLAGFFTVMVMVWGA